MDVSREALRIINLLNEDGNGYLVGGCVRDFVMNRPSHDEDIATSLTPDEVISVLERANLPVIGVGQRFGTVNTRLNGEGFEITTFRKESGYSDSRHPDKVEFTRKLEEDAARRDFTCNAMYYDVRTDKIIDVFGGQDDIRKNMLKTVGNADDRFCEDALRMFRAVRICAEKGFSLDDDVMASIQRNVSLIVDVSAERKASELSRILMSDRARDGFEMLHTSGLLEEVLPKVDAMYDCYQNNPWHMSTVFDHTMRAVEYGPKDLVTRWSLLLHDTGKVPCKTTDDAGVDHFLGHSKVSALIAGDALRDLRFPKDFCNAVEFCVANHDERFVKHHEKNVVNMYVRQYSRHDMFEQNYNRLLDVQAADVLAHSDALDKEFDLKNIDVCRGLFHKMFAGPHHMEDLSVNGFDMMEAGIPTKEIPLMKRRMLADSLLQGHMEDRDYQLKYMKKNAATVHQLYVKSMSDSHGVKRTLPDVKDECESASEKDLV